jgi:hypothetical protein
MYTVCTNGLYIDFVLTHGAVVVGIIWQLDLQSSTQYFSYIMAVSFITVGNQSTLENHRPAASH